MDQGKALFLSKPVYLGKPLYLGKPVYLGKPLYLGKPQYLGKPLYLSKPLYLGKPLDLPRTVQIRLKAQDSLIFSQLGGIEIKQTILSHARVLNNSYYRRKLSLSYLQEGLKHLSLLMQK